MEKKEYRRFYIGVDIGKSGAIVIQEKGEIACYEMPMIKTELDYQALHQLLEPYEAGNGLVVFEKLGVIFGTSKSTAFSMGHQSGAIEMCCVALSIPFVKVPPKQWQQVMFTGVDEIKRSNIKVKSGESRDTKAMSVLACKRRFPQVRLNFGGKAIKPDDNLCDALLMSEFAKNL